MNVPPDFDIYDPNAKPPTDRWFWSTANSSWRLPPAPFRWDRFGLHVPMGMLVGLVSLLMTAAGMALEHNLDMTGAGLIGAILGVTWAALATHLFVKYETTESDAINDIPYPDLSGMLTGLILDGLIAGSGVLAWVFVWA